MTDEMRRALFRECCLSDLRIELGARNPERKKTRSHQIRTLEKARTRQAKFVKDIEDFGIQSWDEAFGRFEGQSYERVTDMHACMVAELHIRKASEALIRAAEQSGNGLDTLPDFIAKRIADIFEMKNWNIGVGKDPHNANGPSGPFCKAIEFAFKAFGAEHHFYRPAKKAQIYSRNKAGQK